MAMASAKAMPINIAGRTLPWASGFLPIASIALKPIIPMASAGPIPPIAMAAPLAKTNSRLFHLPFVSYLSSSRYLSQCAFCVKITIKTSVSIAKLFKRTLTVSF